MNRITLKPSPRDEYWLAQMRALLPKPEPGAATASRVDAALTTAFFAEITSFPQGYLDNSKRSLAEQIEECGGWLSSLSPSFMSDSFHKELERLRQMLEMPWAARTVTIDSWSPAIRVPSVRHWSRALMIHSLWNLAERHDPAAALDDLRLILLLCERLQQQQHGAGITGDGTISWVARQLHLHAVEYRDSFDPRPFVAFAERYAGQSDMIAVTAELARLRVHAALETVFVRSGGWLHVASAARWRNTANFGTRPTISPVWNLCSPFFFDLETMRTRTDTYHEALKRVRCAAELPPSRELENDSSDLLCHRSGLAESPMTWQHWSMVRSIRGYLYALASLNAALLVAEIEHYSIANGVYPDSLEQLSPMYMQKIPHDHISGKPFGYERTAKGYVLFSLGLNAVADSPTKRTLLATTSWAIADADLVFVDRSRP